MTILYLACIVSFLFAIAGFVTMIYGLMYVVVYEDYDSVLPLIYSFFHLCIMVAACYFSINALRKKKSIVMRTMMYVNDYQELTRSKPARIVSIFIIVLGLFLGVFFGLSFILPVGRFFSHMLRLDLVNVGFFWFLMGILFFIFPFLYDIKIDIQERKNKINKKGEDYAN